MTDIPVTVHSSFEKLLGMSQVIYEALERQYVVSVFNAAKLALRKINMPLEGAALYLRCIDGALHVHLQIADMPQIQLKERAEIAATVTTRAIKQDLAKLGIDLGDFNAWIVLPKKDATNPDIGQDSMAIGIQGYEPRADAIAA